MGGCDWRRISSGSAERFQSEVGRTQPGHRKSDWRQEGGDKLIPPSGIR
jgi:hypothetical protein